MTESKYTGTIQQRTIVSKSIDIYVTYRCGLRCSHCFLGDHLNTQREMDSETTESIIRGSLNWGCEEITFLGGEPTLYRHLPAAIKLANELELRTRIVTNGQGSFQRFLMDPRVTDTHICLSLDGATARTHDAIRGRGTFVRLIENARRALGRGFSLSGIVSIGRENYHEIAEVLKLCSELEMNYVNVHYVSSRGFATVASALNSDEWAQVRERIECVSQELDTLEVRYERTFVEKASVNSACAVRDGSNLMFLPDGRVFSCMMFIDIPGSHSYEWHGQQLLERRGAQTELTIVTEHSGPGCPALKLVNPDVVNSLPAHQCVECIYAKHRLNSRMDLPLLLVD